MISSASFVSNSRNNRRMIALLPDPVRPTMPNVVPFSIVK